MKKSVEKRKNQLEDDSKSKILRFHRDRSSKIRRFQILLKKVVFFRSEDGSRIMRNVMILMAGSFCRRKKIVSKHKENTCVFMMKICCLRFSSFFDVKKHDLSGPLES